MDFLFKIIKNNFNYKLKHNEYKFRKPEQSADSILQMQNKFFYMDFHFNFIKYNEGNFSGLFFEGLDNNFKLMEQESFSKNSNVLKPRKEIEMGFDYGIE